MPDPKKINQLTEATDVQDTDSFPLDRTVSEGVFSTLRMTWLTIKTWVLSQLSGKANTSHTQDISTIIGLVDALAGKSSTGHNHDSSYYTKTAIDDLLALLASLSSPDFTGSPTAPTAIAGNSSTLIATTAFVKTALDALIAGAPDALNTLKEISDQLANDENAVAALTIVVASKVPSTRTVAGKALSADITLVKGDVGLPNVDNTSDANKPVSSATQTALDAKQNSMIAASQAEMEAGTETALRSMSPLRVKQAISSLAGAVGGGANGMAGFAFIDTSAGNDSTAILGDPSHPYLTASAGAAASQAFLGGYNAQIYLKNACSENLTFYQPYNLWIYGDGANVSSLYGLYFVGIASSGYIRVLGNGGARISIGNVVIGGIQGFSGSDGSTDGESGGTGSDGQDAPTLEMSGVTIANVSNAGGSGGNGGSGAYNAFGYGGSGGNGGSGRSGGEIIIIDCGLNSGVIQSVGGNGGNGGPFGGGDYGSGSQGAAGNAGSGGKISLFNSRPIQNGVTAPSVSSSAGSPGFGSEGSGMSGINGVLKIAWSETGSYTGSTGEIYASLISNTFTDYYSF